MPIGTIESTDMATVTRFYDDFGLYAVRRSAEVTIYRLEEGSCGILRAQGVSCPPRTTKDPAWGLTTFGISSREELDDYARPAVC